ncbi:MAG: heme-binding protein [Terrimicrobiaceae bacterium]
MTKKLLILPALVLVGGGAFFMASSRAAYETARYDVLSTQGDMELRRYAPMVLATTALGPEDRDNGFGRLFRFISGANEAKQKIAMTTPVFMPSSAKGEIQTMQFVLPADVGTSGAPKPTASNVTLESRPGGVFAALRFRGYGSREKQQKALETLLAWIKTSGRSTKGDPIFAYYDPPWTPEFLRRNEVLIEVTEP